MSSILTEGLEIAFWSWLFSIVKGRNSRILFFYVVLFFLLSVMIRVIIGLYSVWVMGLVSVPVLLKLTIVSPLDFDLTKESHSQPLHFPATGHGRVLKKAFLKKNQSLFAMVI